MKTWTVTLLKVLSLAVACLTYIFWGSVTTPTYYINALRVQYNFTQTQVELVVPILIFGKVLSPVPAAVFQKWGAGPTSTVGVVLGSSGYIFMWISTFYKAFHHEYPVFVYMYYLILGLGSAFVNLSVLTVVTTNFSDKHLGKAISLLETSYAFSPLLTFLVYRLWFSNGCVEDDSRHDLSGFMLFSALTSGMVGILCVGFVRIYETLDTETTSLIHRPAPSLKENASGLTQLDDGQSEWWKRVSAEIRHFLKLPTQLLIWSYAFVYSSFVGFDANQAVYAKAAGLYSAFDGVFISFHVIIFISRLAIGVISDALAESVPRMTYNAVFAFLFALALGVGTFYPTALGSLYFISVTGGIAGGIMRPIFVVVTAKELGKEQFAKNWGIMYSVATVILTCWLMVFAAVFDAGIPVGEEECLGEQCLRWSNLMAFIMMSMSAVLSFILIATKRSN